MTDSHDDEAPPVTLLDGPMGTALEARGLSLPAPLWTAHGVIDHPELVRAAHADYARAGAQVHSTATFRTTARALAGHPWSRRWREAVQRAVTLCREGAAAGAPDVTPSVAGSIAPLEDCYRPDLTPDADTLVGEHGVLAEALAESGADLLLVETMPTLRELAAAVRAAAATDLPVWATITLGPRGDFFTADQVLECARRARDAGAVAFGIDCTPPTLITPLLEELAAGDARPPLLLAYGNALFDGHTDVSPDAYLAEARRWRELGCTIIGTCCGTGREHTAALASAFRAEGGRSP